MTGNDLSWRESATLTHMGESIGIRALQQHASEVVRRAAAGETLTITDRGRPVARIVPLITSPLERMISEGLASPASLPDLPDLLEPSRDVGLGQLLADARSHER